MTQDSFAITSTEMLRPAMKALLRFGWIFSKDNDQRILMFCEPDHNHARKEHARKENEIAFTIRTLVANRSPLS